jgi:LemA protein
MLDHAPEIRRSHLIVAGVAVACNLSHMSDSNSHFDGRSADLQYLQSALGSPKQMDASTVRRDKSRLQTGAPSKWRIAGLYLATARLWPSSNRATTERVFMFPGAVVILTLVAAVVPSFFILMWVMASYNRLVALRNRYRSAYGQIEIQLKRRYDLIASLVEIAKAYITQEQGTLEAVLAARTAALAANSRSALAPGDLTLMKDLAGSEKALTVTLARMLALVNDNSELKANPTMIKLREDLGSTDDQLASARQNYNDAVMNYNTVRETFSTNLIATPFSFGPAELWLDESLVPREVPHLQSG